MGIFIKGRRKPGNRTVEVELPNGIKWTDPLTFDFSDLPLTVEFDAHNKISTYVVVDVTEAFDEEIVIRDGVDFSNIMMNFGSVVSRYSSPGGMSSWIGTGPDHNDIIIKKASADAPTEGVGILRIGYLQLALPE